MSSSGAELNALAFRLFTDRDIRNISVVKMVTPNCFNALNHPLPDGLYDLKMGPNGYQSDSCLTCKQKLRNCSGHFGHIELVVPVKNPIFQKEILGLLKSSCKSCFKIMVPSRYKYLLIYQLKMLSSGYVIEAQELENIIKMDNDETPKNEVTDVLAKEKLLEYINGLQISLDCAKPWTKTMESLRRQFFDSYLSKLDGVKNCPYCKNTLKKIINYRDQFIVSGGKIASEQKVEDSELNENKDAHPYILFPGECKRFLRNVWVEESEFIEAILPILKNTDEEYATDLLFMNSILVTPPKTRPANVVGGKIMENPQTRLYKDIIRSNIIMTILMKALKENEFDGLSEEFRLYIQGIKGENLLEKFQTCWRDLQKNVDALLNSESKSSSVLMGLKQIIEKKEGALRKHMMGKRVNFAARSVITPDPNLSIQEIGVPEYFAKKLTYPVRVNFFNVNDLRRMVMNGPDVHPGATAVESENGTVIRLSAGNKNKTHRASVAKLLLKNAASGGGKIVYRHLLNGDILLLNRQPTLHRPSIMAHKARILKGEKTLRMHYSNCKSYNADFDGDEMNAHFPQNEIARSEAYNIVSVKNNYLVPKDGTPLGGLIQDHVVSGVRLTLRGQFFNRKDYYQLVYQALANNGGDISLLPPSILKPKVLWSGKQIISTILINIIPKNKDLINLNSKAKINHKLWEVVNPRPWKCGVEFKDEKEMSESEVIIRNGRLLCGVLDKQHYGATPYGLAHCLYELYGGKCSTKFLDSLGRLFTSYLQLHGFTLGIKDIIIKEKQDRERKRIIDKVKKIGDIAAIKALELNEIPHDLESRLERAYFTDKVKFRARLDEEYKKILNSYTNDINKVCLPRGLVTPFPENNLQLMVASGAKGSTVNTMQISCLLGQIELEGKRPPWMISGKSLPSFKPFETAPRAGGYIDARFMTGITPQDFFFHCMAGREGLIDTAVKTARSGYLQRCLIKLLEGVTICYDGTVRDHDGSVIQFAYGEDGLEVQRSTFFKFEHMDFLYRNKNSILDKSVLQILKDTTDIKKLEKHKKKIRTWNEKWGGEKWKRKSPNGFSLFSACVRDEIPEKYWTKFNKITGRCKASSKIVKKWNELDDEMKNSFKSIQPDPIISKFNRSRDFGALTEKLDTLIDDYLALKSSRHVKAETMRNIINIKYISSQCDPGEAVGLLAAQSIGEPSTQMTLNTFHFAGRGEMNVTLGIPRLREILMTGSKEIKTPYMDIPLRKTTPEKMEKRGVKLKKKFQTVVLADVLEKIEIHEKLITSPQIVLMCRIKFCFLPHKSYQKLFNVNPKKILFYMEKEFLLSLTKKLRRLGKKYGDCIIESKEDRTVHRDDQQEEEEEEETDNKSVDMERQRKRQDSASSEEEPEGDDDDATTRRIRERHEQEMEYDEPEDQESNESDESDECEEENATGSVGVENSEETPATVSVEDRLHFLDRQKFVLTTFPAVKEYTYDLAKEEWCEMVFHFPTSLNHTDFSTILRDICNKSIIYSISNVKRAILYKNPAGSFALKTEGINLIEVFKYSKMLDLNKLYSNDIHEVARVFGIEAAARVVVNELKEVFAVYGIAVDSRHLLLIADFMTHQGYFSAFNRMTMVSSPSPFQQMTFESTVSFLKAAINWSKTDALNSPSARIMMGKYCNCGTGCFDLLNERVSCLTEKQQTKEMKVCPAYSFE